VHGEPEENANPERLMDSVIIEKRAKKFNLQLIWLTQVFRSFFLYFILLRATIRGEINITIMYSAVLRSLKCNGDAADCSLVYLVHCGQSGELRALLPRC